VNPATLVWPAAAAPPWRTRARRRCVGSSNALDDCDASILPTYDRLVLQRKLKRGRVGKCWRARQRKRTPLLPAYVLILVSHRTLLKNLTNPPAKQRDPPASW
jgi:hypothetical protein